MPSFTYCATNPVSINGNTCEKLSADRVTSGSVSKWATGRMCSLRKVSYLEFSKGRASTGLKKRSPPPALPLARNFLPLAFPETYCSTWVSYTFPLRSLWSTLSHQVDLDPSKCSTLYDDFNLKKCNAVVKRDYVGSYPGWSALSPLVRLELFCDHERARPAPCLAVPQRASSQCTSQKMSMTRLVIIQISRLKVRHLISQFWCTGNVLDWLTTMPQKNSNWNLNS